MKKFKLLTIALGIATASISCTDDFDELNTDRTNLTEATVDLSTFGLIFAQSQHSGMMHLPIGPTSFFPWRFQTAQSLFPDLYVQYFATTAPYFQTDQHEIIGGWNDATWEGFYSFCAPQLKFFEDFTTENELPVENAIGKVWKVFAYNRITTFYGPIPYSEFGNGEKSVAYDTQESIYNDAFVKLDEAVAVLNSAGSTSLIGNNDGIYGGDPSKWLKFANTLRLRLAIHIKNANPTLAKSEAEKAVAAGVIESVSDNAMLATNGNSKNGHNVVTAWGEFRMSASMESVLKGFDDPRMPEFFSPAANGDGDGDGVVYEGFRNGQTIADRSDANLDLNGSNSNMGARFLPDALSDQTPITVIRAAEAYFLRAEGSLQGWNMGATTQSLYESGINASLEEWGTPNAAYASSTNTPAPVGDVFNTPALSDISVAFDTGGSADRQLEQIMTQKWLALYPDSWESWTDVRRTGYPTLFDRIETSGEAESGVGVSDIMSRVTFVSSEYDNNSDAVDNALTLPEMSGGDNGGTKLWIHQ